MLHVEHARAGTTGDTPDAVLSRVFGFPGFRGLQRQAVDRVMAGGDALVLMPTGGGKSVCYQVPALCRPGTGLVVSPLIALMDDQVAALRQLGVNAGALHSELDPDEANRIRNDLAAGRLDLLYVSPERLLAGNMLDRLSRIELSVIAIDEAHCVSAWGHEFRPEYRALAQLPQRLPGVPRIALTATADPRTRADIIDALAMPDAEVLVASFHRANLHIAARPKGSELTQLIELLGRHKGEASIVYCGSRNKTERIARSLRERDWPAIPFHAGLSPLEKRAGLLRFRSGEPVVIVATIAFGMGIDRPDVRSVVHLDMPDSPEGYYQQIGRAGRDGERSDTLLLFGGEDMARARHWLDQSQAPPAQKRVMSQRLESDDRPRRDHRLPHPRPAPLLRRVPGPGLRPLRQLPQPARHLRRHGGRAEGAVRHLPHRPDVRRPAHRLGAARQADRRGEAPPPRRARPVWHRQARSPTPSGAP